MGRITDVNNDQKGLVHGEHAGNENSRCKLEQPIDKIVLLIESNHVK